MKLSYRLFWTNFILAIFIGAWGGDAIAKPKRKKDQISITDPKLGTVPNVKKSEPSAPIEGSMLPNALVRSSEKSGENEFSSELPDDKFAPIPLDSLKQLVFEKEWDVLVSTVEFWLMARKDLNLGERLRLEMIRSLALAHLGRRQESLGRLEFFKKYLDLSLASLRFPKDVARVQGLKAHLLLTEYDINQLKELSR